MKLKLNKYYLVDGGNVRGIAQYIHYDIGDTIPHLFEFINKIESGHDGLGKGKNDHCWWFNEDEDEWSVSGPYTQKEAMMIAVEEQI